MSALSDPKSRQEDCATSKASTRLLYAAALAIALQCGLLSIARYLSFHNRTFDLAFYARILWGLGEGNFWEPIVGGHVLGLHLSFALLPLVPLVRIFDPALVLLSAQSIAVGAALLPLGRFAQRRAGLQGICAAALTWAFYPNLMHVAAYEFHPGTLALCPLAWMLDALDARRPRAFALAAFAALACREDLALMIAMAGLLYAYRHRELPSLLLGLASAFAALAYLAAFALLLHPRFAPAQGSMQAHFGAWGNSVLDLLRFALHQPLAIAAHLAAPQRLLYLPKVLLPLAFLPLLRPRWLWVASPALAINLLSHFPTTTKLYSHYLSPALPCLIVAALDGWADLRSRKVAPPHWQALALACLFLAHFVAGGSPLALDFPAEDYRRDQRSSDAARSLRVIPPRRSLQAPDELLPHLVQRPRLHRVPPPDRGTDIVVLPLAHRLRFAGREDLLRTTEEPELRRWLSRSDYGLRFATPSYLVFERGLKTPSPFQRRYYRPPSGRVARGAELALPRGLTRLSACLTLEAARLRAGRIQLDLIALKPCPADLALRFGRRGDALHQVELLFDGALSPAQLRAGDRLRSSHAGRGFRVGDELFLALLREKGAPPDAGDPRVSSLRLQ